MSNKFKAEVIEVYPSEGKAAVRFSWRNRERIECVNMYAGSDCQALAVGMAGWAAYHSTSNIGVWGFAPFKKQPKPNTVCMSKDQAIETAMQLRDFFKVKGNEC